MSILPILAKIKEYNTNKPSMSCQDTYELTPEDRQKIQVIADDILKLKPPYEIMMMFMDKSQQLYLRCTEGKKPEQKTVFRPIPLRGPFKK